MSASPECLRGEVLSVTRSVTLPSGVTMKVEARGGRFRLACLGTTDALLASGLITPSMMATREAFRQGDARGLRDEHGKRFTLHCAPTKGEPDRMKLTRRMEPERAVELPCVSDLFPEVQRSLWLHEALAADIREETTAIELPPTISKLYGQLSERQRGAIEERIRIEAHEALANKRAELAHADTNGIPPTRQRPSLRLVVNNEFAGGCTP
jgi:hypothetical protein